MDEEELKRPSSKINVGSFFERVDSVEKVADNALSRSNANLGIISNQKLIINSLSVTIEAMETKIRDIANYIIIEKKLEKDVEEDRALEEQDRLQKQAMVDRATTIMGEPGPQGEPGKPAEQQQGGGSSLLGALLKLGATAFALKYIGPVLLPKLLLLAKTKLIPLIGTALKSGFVKLAALIGKVITGLVSKIPLVGKALAGSALFTGVGSAIIGIGNFISNALGGKGGGADSLNVEGGTEVEKENLVNGDESMRDTLSKKDLMVTPGTRIDEEGALGGGEPSSGDLSMFDEDEVNFKTEFKEGSYELSSNEKDGVTNISTKFEGVTRFDIETGKAYILGEEVTHEGYNEYINLPDRDSKDAMIRIIEKYAVNKVEPVNNQSKIEVETKNKNLDLSSDNIDGDMTQAIAKTNERIDNLIGAENKEQNNGNLVSANKPNVTEATLKPAAAPLTFVKVLKNNQLSTSPKPYNGLPPEIAAMIS